MNTNDIVSVSISPSPATNLARVATVDEFAWLPREKKIRLVVRVEYLDSQGEVICSEGITAYSRTLDATNHTFVDENGIVVPDGEVGEYDFYIAMVNQAPIPLFDVLKQNILQADQSNRFD